MMYSNEEFYEDSPMSKLNHEDQGSNYQIRAIKAVKNTRSQIIPSISLASTMQDDHEHSETPCPSFDLHLYAHIDRSSLNRCVFTPVPHQTDEPSQTISRKRKFQSCNSTHDHPRNTKFGHDNGELAEIVYNMDLRLDELTRTCNGLRSSLHNLTKMVTQLVNNQKQNNDNTDELDETESTHEHSSSNLSSAKTTSNSNKRSRSSNDSSSQRPTEFLCRLIRKVYSTNEIVAGITPDERLDRIKEAVADRYFPDEPDRFEVFWAREAHQSILGQARAQRCRDKKAGSFFPDPRLFSIT